MSPQVLAGALDRETLRVARLTECSSEVPQVPTVITVPERFERTAPDTLPLRPGFVLTCLDVDRWELAGELDCASGPMLAPAVEASLPSTPLLFLECREIEFIDVAGWRALGLVRRMLEPATELRLCHPSAMLRRLMVVLGHP
jgi:hypothetical protein